MTPWTDAGWRAGVDAWIDAEAERLGRAPVTAIEQPHIRPWATVLRVEAGGATLWFKAVEPALRHEVALTELVAARAPALAPVVLAADAARGWLLLDDAGERLREVVARGRTVEPWLEVLPLYAELQLALAADVDGVLARGVPHVRLPTLADDLDSLLRDLASPEAAAARSLVPRVRHLAAELGAFGLPETLQHDDLHDGQVFVGAGQPRILDWGDACVSHPFFTLAVTLQGVIAWGVDDVEASVDVTPYRDAYLRPWRRAFPTLDLERAVEVALPLGWACRAVNGHLDADPGATHARLGMLESALRAL